MPVEMKDDGGEHIVHKEGAGKKEEDPGRGHYELVSPMFMRRLSIWLERGAGKYEPRNWEKGIPMGRIMRALLRHSYQYLEGMRDEDHLAAITCNVMFLIHFEEAIERGLLDAKEIDDLPNYLVKKMVTMAKAFEKELATAFICEVEGCDETIPPPPFARCEKHNCCTECDDTRMPGEIYCSGCKCIGEHCHLPKKRGTSFCHEHAFCKALGCITVVTVYAEVCTNHCNSCAVAGCWGQKVFTTIWCPKHVCGMRNCELQCAYEDDFCEHHRLSVREV